MTLYSLNIKGGNLEAIKNWLPNVWNVIVFFLFFVCCWECLEQAKKWIKNHGIDDSIFLTSEGKINEHSDIKSYEYLRVTCIDRELFQSTSTM